MASASRLFARLIVTAVLLIPATSPSPRASTGETPTAGAEVRLRKLHLVRPDLIPYPIAYEVCC
jgi:hypothetical protein